MNPSGASKNSDTVGAQPPKQRQRRIGRVIFCHSSMKIGYKGTWRRKAFETYRQQRAKWLATLILDGRVTRKPHSTRR